MFREIVRDVPKVWGAYQSAKGGHSLFLMQGPNDCNRLGTCAYCEVPAKDDRQNWSSFPAATGIVDWAKRQGFGTFNYKGGESLADCPPKRAIISKEVVPCSGNSNRRIKVAEVRATEARFRTEQEGMSFFDYTKGLVKHASEKHMVTCITSNGDFLRRPQFNQTEDESGVLMPDNLIKLRKLKRAGLDILALSLHSYNIAGLTTIVGLARAVAREGIIPVVSVVCTAERAETIPLYAKICAANGILFSTAPVQRIGGMFSAGPEKTESPTSEQMQRVSDSLLPLKRKGFIFNTEAYLQNLAELISRPWKCDPDQNYLVHAWALGENGQLGVCQERATQLDSSTDLKSEEWKKVRKAIVSGCSGCAYACNLESGSIVLKKEFSTLRNMALIKTGRAGLVRRLGQRAVAGTEGLISIPACDLEIAQDKFYNYQKIYKRVMRAGAEVAIIRAGYLLMGLFYVPIKLDQRKRSYEALSQSEESIKEEEASDILDQGRVCGKNCMSDFF
ncbi:hypothetical protein A3J19_00690 [Candidatus Daviesbacteria bacterium RIFCSPLOWO2_02_FULL_41_8]|uniref:Radical SAM core domain-containing protein n=1 Tax=Candidatus Daviesbacteria bacterium RIFCSPLOWO2_02_FULL_41_8 TaxID=1797798 RepID=A0A1F5NHZ9_9BACT|nr:MAG: hypothetical protein A3J19_00690 [Candidatus Daviesbacteria bacterium RIFCSPLOWO2_02_FULL_41_8]